jgi:ribose/xylose/arabinose/galactoside ABC-type transport system permease subunit
MEHGISPVSAAEVLKRSFTSIAFVALFAGYAAWLGGLFFNTGARMLDVQQNAPVLLISLSVVVTLIAGQFDLSVGNMATLTNFLVIGLRSQQGWPFWLVLIACLLVGLAGGVVNGILVVKFHINTFIATLATGGVLLGLSTVYSGGASLSASGPTASHSLPGWFTGPGSFGAFSAVMPSWVPWSAFAILMAYLVFRAVLRARTHRPTALLYAGYGTFGLVAALIAVFVMPGVVAHMSWTIGALIAITWLLWLVVERLPYGRFLRAAGQNSAAARLAGVRTGSVTIRAFALGGLLAALAGVFLGADIGSAQPNVGAGYLLPAFAAAFVSTVLLSNGRFTIWGTVVGGLILVYVSQGLIDGGIQFTWTGVVNGVVLAVAVGLSTIFKRS